MNVTADVLISRGGGGGGGGQLNHFSGCLYRRGLCEIKILDGN